MSLGGGDAPRAPTFSNEINFGDQTALGTVSYGQTLRDFYLPTFTNEVWPYVQNYANEAETAAHNSTDFSQRINDIYANAYGPLNYQFVQSLQKTYGDNFPVFAEQQAGAAAADQFTAGNAALQNSIRQLMSYGVDPSSEKFGTALTTGNIMTAANAASAAAMARRGALQDKFNALGSGVQIGGALPTQFANLTYGATQARTTGLSGVNQALTTAGNVLGTPLDAVRAATGAANTASNATQSSGSLVQEAAKTNQAGDSALGTGLGNVFSTVGNIITKPLSGSGATILGSAIL